MFEEYAVAFNCEGEQLIGILTSPPTPAELGVVILVGGPQYRIGSHRQFVHLARALANDGYASLRFDFRGMGDSTGDSRTFEAIDADICAAIDFFQSRLPKARRIVLWGLCDAATAAMMYAPSDPRVAGLVLANPWARATETHARTMLAHYYLKRLISRSFWEKLGSRQVDLKASTSEVFGSLATSARGDAGKGEFRVHMARAMSQFEGKALHIICERDLTAREFEAFAHSDMRATLAKRQSRDSWVRFPNADHTFSGSSTANEVAQVTADWMRTHLYSVSSRLTN